MKAILFAVLAAVCWGVGEVCTKHVLATGKVGTTAVLLVRTVAIVPLVVLVWAASAYWLKAEPARWWDADSKTLGLLFGGSALAAGFGGVFCFYLGLRFGDISVVKPIAFTLAPAIAVLLGWLILGEPMTLRKGIAIGMLLGGLVLLATSPHAPAR